MSINFSPACLVPEYNCERHSPSRSSIVLALLTVVLQGLLLVLAIRALVSRLSRQAGLVASKPGEVLAYLTRYFSGTGKQPYRVVEEIWSEFAQAFVPRLASQARQHGPEYLFTIRLRYGADRTDGNRPALTLHSPELVRILAQLMDEDLVLGGQQPEVAADDVFFLTESLRELYDRLSDAHSRVHFKDVVALQALLDWLDQTYSETRNELRRSTDTDHIPYHLLWCRFRRTAKGIVLHDGSCEPLGVLINSSGYVSISGQPCFRVRGNYYAYDGESWQVKQSEVLIPKFDGWRPIHSLPITPLTLKSQHSLTQRGELARQHAGLKYLQYHGSLVRCMGTGAYRRTAQEWACGRCMVDVRGYWNIVAESDVSAQTHCSELNQVDPDAGAARLRKTGLRRKKIRDADCWRLSPTLHGFSFVTKTWGELLVHQLSEVEFDQCAIDKIVLPVAQKRLVRRLIESADHDCLSVSETVIDQKQAAVVICLYGAAGSGKTSTASALAESLGRPLLRIGCGELGSEAPCVARKLKDTFSLASAWKAIVLIEEADLFLQERDMQEVARNALVSVFLKSLQNFTGVLFLTATRVKCFDSGVISRVSMAVKYPDLDQITRKHIWTDSLKRVGVETAARHDRRLSSKIGDDQRNTGQKIRGKVTDIELEELSRRSFNGKMIENLIRTALKLAGPGGETLGYSHLLQVIQSFEHVISIDGSEAIELTLNNNHIKEESDDELEHNYRVYY